jgi:ubiquitin-like protein Pup
MRERKTRAQSAQSKTVEETEPASTAEAQAISEETDDLLDEIDSVLEENAEEFVRQYVQKGGE